MRVGLTGGIGSGKSEVARLLAERGALVVDADALAREALAPASAGLRAVASRWPDVVTSDGALDRPALAARIFADEEARAFVNGIVHPYVRARSAAIERTAAPGQLVVHDVPLLFEAGFHRDCDASVLVVAPRQTRVARLVARNGWSREEIERRMAAQIDPDAARSLADEVVENDGSLAELRERVAALEDRLRRRAMKLGSATEVEGGA